MKQLIATSDSTQPLNMEVEFRVGNSRVVLYSIFIHVELSHHKNLFLKKKTFFLSLCSVFLRPYGGRDRMTCISISERSTTNKVQIRFLFIHCLDTMFLYAVISIWWGSEWDGITLKCMTHENVYFCHSQQGNDYWKKYMYKDKLQIGLSVYRLITKLFCAANIIT